MIAYNMRYRGPLEYDKTILNVLQFYNEIIDLKTNELEEIGLTSLKDIQETINILYEKFTSNNKSHSLSELAYIKSIGGDKIK